MSIGSESDPEQVIPSENTEAFDMETTHQQQVPTSEDTNPSSDVLSDQEQSNPQEPTEKMWFSRLEIAELIRAPLLAVKTVTDFLESSPLSEETSLVRIVTKDDVPIKEYDRQVIDTVSSRLPAPDNWVSEAKIATLAECDPAEVQQILSQIKKRRYIDVRPCLADDGETTAIYISPGLAEDAISILRTRQEPSAEPTNETNAAEELFIDFMLSREELGAIIQLIGADDVLEIMYHFHPEYRSIPIEQVWGNLSDYLGDCLMTPAGVNGDILRKTAELLTRKQYRTALLEGIKRDCITNYNHRRRADPSVDEYEFIHSYIFDLKQELGDFENEHLTTVLDKVETYFEEIDKELLLPNYFVDRLRTGRPFPDLNQKVNIKEILEKKRMLIADEPGLGKSLSAIAAKEISGVQRAVIVAPSSIIGDGNEGGMRVWQDYLSDKINEKGKQVGYFKPGEAPKYIVVSDPRSLDDIDPNFEGYIIISHERLEKGDYVNQLIELGFDMLIVDEAHKLKNISEGHRAGSLIRLADALQGRKNAMTAILTATPADNKVEDIAMVMRLLYPAELKHVKNPDLVKALMVEDYDTEGRPIRTDIGKLRASLSPRMQIKLARDCLDLPEAVETIEYVDISEKEERLMERIIDDDEQTMSAKSIAVRQMLLNPAIIEATPDIVPSKAVEVSRQINQALEAGSNKFVVYVNEFTHGVLHKNDPRISDHFDLPDDVELRFIYGDVSMKQRLEMQKEFQDSDKRIVLMVQGQTADVGIDLSAADDLYFYNEPWTMAQKRQQIGRCQRPGRTSPLTIKTFIARGTIEEGVYDYIRRKDRAIRKLLFGIPRSQQELLLLQRDQDGQPSITEEVTPELAQYFVRGQQAIFRVFRNTRERGQQAFSSVMKRVLIEPDDPDNEEDEGYTGAHQYADQYKPLTARSYPANMARLTASVIRDFLDERGKSAEKPVILDLGSGPQMLRRNMVDEFQANIISLDINKQHFIGEADGKQVASPITAMDNLRARRKNAATNKYQPVAPAETGPGGLPPTPVGRLPFKDKSADYISLGLVLDSSRYPLRNENNLEKLLTTETASLERLVIFQELNRVLKPGGRVVITETYQRALEDSKKFAKLMHKLGFRVIESHSGKVSARGEDRGTLITVEKVADCDQDPRQIIEHEGVGIMAGLRFIQPKAKVKTPKKIDHIFHIEGQGDIVVAFNGLMKQVVQEEDRLMSEMTTLTKTFGSINDIPIEQLVQRGISRYRYKPGKYELFKELTSADGAIQFRL